MNLTASPLLPLPARPRSTPRPDTLDELAALLAASPPLVSQRGPTVIRCERVTKEFGKGETKTQVLRGIDLDLPAGELTLLVGPSGCGKTTLVSIIAGLLDPTAGRVEVLGQDLTAMSNRRKTAFRGANIGFVFQQYNLLPSLTAAENAAVPLLIAGWSRARAVEKASHVLDLVGLGHRLNAFSSQLSGGQQQRVAIARALVHEPRLLVCDEPTAALDAESGQTVMGLLREVAIKPDRGVIIVTHDSRVFDFGDRVVTLSDGRVVSESEHCPRTSGIHKGSHS